MTIDLTTENNYFGNTTTSEEDILLATLSRAEARELGRKIAERNRKRFPGIEKRLGGNVEEFFKGFELDADQEDPDWLKN